MGSVQRIELHALDLFTLTRSSFRQIRNVFLQDGVVDQLETAIAAALTGPGVRSVFRHDKARN